MFSIGKIFTLIIILLAITLYLKFFQKSENLKIKDPKNLDVSKCPSCGVWTSEKICTNNNCPFDN